MLLKCRSPESTSTNLHVKDRQSFQIHFQAHESALQTEFCDKLQVSLLPDLQKNNGQSAEHAEAAQWHPQIKTADIWQWRKVVEKERWEVAVACSLSSAEHPSPLCRWKIQEAAAVLFKVLWNVFSPPSFFCLVFVWMISSFISFLCPDAHSRICCKNI